MSSGTMVVLIASGNPAYAAGLASFIAAPPFVPVVAHTVDAALRAADERTPGLAIVDWALGDAPGVELAAEIAVRHPSARLLMCLPDGDVRRQIETLGRGAAAVILPTWTAQAVLQAVRDALDCDAGVDVGVVRSLVDLDERTEPRRVLLTHQERVVLRLMRQQLTYKEIALHLGISWHTVRSHAQSILRKLGVHSRRDLDAWDARMGSGALSLAGARR